MEIKEGKDFSSQSREREKERIMSQSLVSNWNLKQQRQEPDEDEGKRSSHVQNRHQNPPVPKPDYEVTELTWENGNLAMHGLCGLGRAPPSKPMWCQVGGTLESVIHQATHNKRISSSTDYNNNPENMNSVVASSGGRWAENSTEDLMGPDQKSKRARSKTSPQRRQLSHGNSNGTSFLDTDTTMWASFESPASLKTKTADEDSSCRSGPENIDEELENKNGNGPPLSSRRSRSAAIHNQSERRRRDRINEKMKALQKLVPNSSKTDKASMLDEVIEYLKQLQAQLQMMSMRSMPQMMMPLGVQPHLQMSLLAGMGMGMSMGTGMGMGTSMGGGMGLGLVDMTRINHPTPPIPPILHPPPPAAAATFVPSPFILPAIMRPHTTTNPNSDPTTHPPIPLHDPYSAFFTQTMNIDLYNKMAALYQQQFNQTTQSNSSKHENQVPHD